MLGIGRLASGRGATTLLLIASIAGTGAAALGGVGGAGSSRGFAIIM